MSRRNAGYRTAFGRLTMVAIVLGVLLAGTQLVAAAPPPPYDFTVTPSVPLVGQTVTFTATGLKPEDVVSWDFDNDGTIDATGATVQHAYATAGQHTVRMRVTKADLTFKEVVKTVRVNASPNASFTASPNPAAIGETVQFNASGSSDPGGSIVSYAWDLDGNGSFETATGSTATTSRAYTTAGTVNVRLRVTDADGATSEATRAVIVNARPVASFTATPNPALVGQSVSFSAAGSSDPDGTIASYGWDLDNDGQFDDASGATASRSFGSPGNYTVRLSVTDNRGATDTSTLTVVVNSTPSNQIPVASFTATPNPAATGQSVQFNAGGSSDPDGAIASYAWDLDGNGSFETLTGSIPTTSKVYSDPGTVNVKLRVTDNGGATAERTVAVVVQNRAPVASFTTTPNPAVPGQTVSFNAGGSSDPDGTIASYAWDLDNDGQFDDASGATASRSFAAPGPYTVRLSVTDNRGATDTSTVTVTVNATPVGPPANQPPVASFTVSPGLPLSGDIVTLTSTSSDPDGAIASYAWDLDGDGQFDDSSAPTPSVRFGTSGFFTVSLRVTDANGATDIERRTIFVGARPASTAGVLELMSPFPIVRLVARLTSRGANVRLLRVRDAPRGATVTVRCRGGGCRLRARSKTVVSGSVRFRSFERRLRGGTSLQIRVTQPGKIGKYTSFRIRRARAPLRRDRCVISVSSRPGLCPSS